MKFFVLIALFVCGGIFVADATKRVIPQPFENKHGMWLGPIVLGSPQQWNMVHLDTETGDLFFVDANCKTQGCTDNRVGFNGKKSSTFYEPWIKIPYSTTYMGTKQSGRIVFDSPTALGLASPPSIPLPLVDKTTGAFTKSYGAGVFGLGFSDSWYSITFFELIDMVLDDQSYSFHVDNFTHTQANGLQDSGYGVFGGIDTDHCDETTVVYHPLSKSRQWSVKVDSLGGGSLSLKGGIALIKPGPFHILGPKSEIDKIYNHLQVQKDSKGEPTISCGIIDLLPGLGVTIEGRKHIIQSKDYTVQSDNNTCYLLFKEIGSDDAKKADWVFGDVLFRDRCVVFSYKKEAIGFTKRK